MFSAPMFPIKECSIMSVRLFPIKDCSIMSVRLFPIKDCSIMSVRLFPINSVVEMVSRILFVPKLILLHFWDSWGPGSPRMAGLEFSGPWITS